MGRKEKIEAEVNFRPRGLVELKNQWHSFAGMLMEPAVLMAAGVNKAGAAWASIKGIVETKVLGPLALVSGASFAFLQTTQLLVAQWRALGMASAATLERMTLQFRPLMGSMDGAKQRVKELMEFSGKSPFNVDDIVEGNKSLQILTQGALATNSGMKLVGDTAAKTGNSFSDVARSTGKLYDELMSGRPIGAAARQLQEMGAISGTTRNQIESMQAANVSGLEIWKVVEKQFARNSGAMEQQNQSLEVLQAKWKEAKAQMEAGFSSKFMEGEKAGVEASTKMMEAMTPVMRALGTEFSKVDNTWEKLKARVMEGVTSWKGFGSTVEWVIKGMTALAATFVVASGVSIVKFTIGLLKLAAGNKAVAQSAEYLNKIEQASIPVSQKLSSIKNALAAANTARVAGMKEEAAAQLGAAAAGVKNIVTTNGMVGAVKVGGIALRGMGMAARFVAASMKEMAVALLANPLVWVTAAVMVAVEAFSKYSAVQAENKERLEGYQKATSAINSGIKEQIADIKTMVDLRHAESKILSELTAAYISLEKAQNPEEKQAAQERIDQLQGSLRELPRTDGLEMDDDKLGRYKSQREWQLRGRREYERDMMAAKGPEEAAQVAKERLDEVERRKQAAIELDQAEQEAARKMAQHNQANTPNEAARSALLQKEMELKQKAAAAPRFSPRDRYYAAKIDKELSDTRNELAKIPVKGDTHLNDALGSPHELLRINAQLAALDDLKSKQADLNKSRDALRQNSDPNKTPELQGLAADAQVALERAQKNASHAGVAGMSPVDRQMLEARRDEIKARRTEDESEEKRAAAAKANRDAQLALAEARLDSEAAIAGLRLRGFEREQKLLEIEQQRLDLRLKADNIGQGEYQRERELISARKDALAREINERNDELAGSYLQSKVKREEEEARRAGNPALAEELRRKNDELDDQRARREAMAEGRGSLSGRELENYADLRTAEAHAAREAERKRQWEERAAAMGGAEAHQGSGEAAIQAEILRYRGKSTEARIMREKAARVQDNLDRKAAEKHYREMGYSASDASRMANKDVKLTQAERLMQSLTQTGGTVVAHSLAKIGGGGNVTGTDPNTRLLERVVKLVEDIRNDGKKDVPIDMEP